MAKQYSFYNVDLIIDGDVVTGFADGDSIITASRNREAHNQIVDARGSVVYNTIADLTGTITFSLLQVSDWNSKLREMIEVTQGVGLSGNAGTFKTIQVSITDKMGNTRVSGINGVILDQPSIIRGTGINTTEWNIAVERLLLDEGTSPEA